MIAQNLDIEITIGLPFTMYIPIIGTDGSIIDPATATYAGKIVTYVGKSAVATFTMTTGVDESGQDSLIVQLPAITTSTLAMGVCRYDIKMTDTSTGDVQILCEGTARIFDMASA